MTWVWLVIFLEQLSPWTKVSVGKGFFGQMSLDNSPPGHVVPQTKVLIPFRKHKPIPVGGKRKRARKVSGRKIVLEVPLDIVDKTSADAARLQLTPT